MPQIFHGPVWESTSFPTRPRFLMKFTNCLVKTLLPTEYLLPWVRTVLVNIIVMPCCLTDIVTCIILASSVKCGHSCITKMYSEVPPPFRVTQTLCLLSAVPYQMCAVADNLKRNLTPGPLYLRQRVLDNSSSPIEYPVV